MEAIPSHAQKMHEIEQQCFSMPWSEASIRYEILQKHSISFVAIDDNEIIGHIYMRHIINEGHIINLATKNSHRKQGIGSLLVNRLVQVAREREMIGLTLEVRESNIAAISLYKKHGFIVEGIRKDYYSNPTENGLIMWRTNI